MHALGSLLLREREFSSSHAWKEEKRRRSCLEDLAQASCPCCLPAMCQQRLACSGLHPCFPSMHPLFGVCLGFARRFSIRGFLEHGRHIAQLVCYQALLQLPGLCSAFSSCKQSQRCAWLTGGAQRLPCGAKTCREEQDNATRNETTSEVHIGRLTEATYYHVYQRRHWHDKDKH